MPASPDGIRPRSNRKDSTRAERSTQANMQTSAHYVKRCVQLFAWFESRAAPWTGPLSNRNPGPLNGKADRYLRLLELLPSIRG